MMWYGSIDDFMEMTHFVVGTSKCHAKWHDLTMIYDRIYFWQRQIQYKVYSAVCHREVMPLGVTNKHTSSEIRNLLELFIDPLKFHNVNIEYSLQLIWRHGAITTPMTKRLKMIFNA